MTITARRNPIGSLEGEESGKLWFCSTLMWPAFLPTLQP